MTITGHIYRYGTDSYTTFTMDVEPDATTGYLKFHRPSGKYHGHIMYMEPTNEHTNNEDTRWYVHVVPEQPNTMPFGFYVSQEDMWKLDAITYKTPA